MYVISSNSVFSKLLEEKYNIVLWNQFKTYSLFYFYGCSQNMITILAREQIFICIAYHTYATHVSIFFLGSLLLDKDLVACHGYRFKLDNKPSILGNFIFFPSQKR